MVGYTTHSPTNHPISQSLALSSRILLFAVKFLSRDFCHSNFWLKCCCSNAATQLLCEAEIWLKYLQMIVGGCCQLEMILTPQVCASQSILCQLFAQDWPNLCWGRFNNIEVDSITSLEVTILKYLYKVLSKPNQKFQPNPKSQYYNCSCWNWSASV